MIPFYIYYSMFGFQRVGDLAWAAGDSRARGFLLGGTAGRTTLNGEGLQHEDGHSHLLSLDDPELRLLRPDLRARGRGDRPGRPAADARRAGGRLLLPHADERELPPPRDAGGRRGGDQARACTCCARARSTDKPRVQLLGSGTILREVLAAAELLEADHGVAADVWSVTSFTELARDGIETERWNLLHPTEEARRALRRDAARRAQRAGRSRRPTTCARSPSRSGPTCRAPTPCSAPTASAAATTASSCAASSRSTATTSTVAALKALADGGELEPAAVQKAIETYDIDPDRPAPLRV